jgi:hypothetical protein
LDRKSLPFSYLVLVKTRRGLDECLPALGSRMHRLVSPAHREGQDEEFFLCGQEGKIRARARGTGLERGDILLDAVTRGDPNATRVESFRLAGTLPVAISEGTS